VWRVFLFECQALVEYREAAYRDLALATLDLLHLRMRLAAQWQVQVSKSPGAHLPEVQVPGSAGVTVSV